MRFPLLVALFCAALRAWSVDTGDYLIASPENFQTVRSRALECLSSESTKTMLGARHAELVRHYESLPSDVSRLEQDRVSLQRSHLAFRKLFKRCTAGEYAKLGPQPLEPGKHDETSPVLGAMASDRLRLQELAESKPEILRFGNALYNLNPNCPGTPGGGDSRPNPVFLMLPSEIRAQAQAESARILREHVRGYGVTDTKRLTAPAFLREGVVLISDIDNAWNDWVANAHVEEKGIAQEYQGKSYWTPPEMIALHEVHHLEQTLPGERDLGKVPPRREAVDELGSMILQIVRSDEVYKAAKKVPLATVVRYPADYPAGLRVGEIANVYRPLLAKYGSAERALASTESLAFMKKHFSGTRACPPDPRGSGSDRLRPLDQSFPRPEAQQPRTLK